MKKVYQNSFFEEITPDAVICSRGEPFYLGIMTHPLRFVGTVPHLFWKLVYTIERGTPAKKWPRFHASLKMYLIINNLPDLLWRRPAPPDHDVPCSSLAGLRLYFMSAGPRYRMTPSAVILIFTSASPFSSSITNHSPEGVSMYSASSIFQDG